MEKVISWQTMDFAHQKSSRLPLVKRVKRALRIILAQLPIFELLVVIMIAVFAIFVVSLLRGFETNPQELARLKYLA